MPNSPTRLPLVFVVAALSAACGGGGGGEDGPAVTGDLAFTGGPTLHAGSAVTGASALRTVTVQSSSNEDATAIVAQPLAAPFSFAGGSYPGTGGTCGAALGAGASCTIVVAFAPSAAAPASATLRLDYTLGTARSISATLTGDGLAPALVTLSGAPAVDLGAAVVGASSSALVTVTNGGGVDATSADGTLTGPFAFTGVGYPGLGGTCGPILGPGSSCTVEVAFQPIAAGAGSGELTLSFHDGAAPASAARALAGLGRAPAALSVSGAAFPQSLVGGSSQAPFTITHSGDVPASSLGVTLTGPFAFTGGAYPGAAGTCGVALSVGASCTLDVTFTPAAHGAATGSIQLAWHDGAAAASGTFALAGAGYAPASISVAGSSDLGGVVLGSAGQGLVTLTNSGAVAATAVSLSTLGPFAPAGGAWPGTRGTCGATLAAGASCEVDVEFTPSARGAASGTLGVIFHDGLATASVSATLSGTGLAPAALAFADAPLATFADTAVGGSRSLTLAVSNDGDVAATGLAAPPLAAPWAFTGGYPGPGGTCGGSLAAGASCVVAVTFSPGAAGGATGTLALDYASGAGAASASLSLAGRGALPASLDLSGAGDFGGVTAGAVVERTLTLTNSGEVAATGVAGTVSGAGFAFTGAGYPGAGGTCTASLAAGASCTLAVAFAPAAAGVASGGVAVAYHDGVAPRSAPAFSLSGTGLAPASLAVSGAPAVDFGPVVLGASGSAFVTLTNSGEVAATAVAAVPPAPFGFVGGASPGTGGTCTATLAPGASCTLALAFAPAAAGPATGSLAVSYHDGAGPRAAARSLSGTGLGPAALSLSGAADLGPALVGGSSEADVVVTNAPGGAAAASLVVALGGPFARVGGDCGGALAAGASCTIRVAFAPVARGDATGSLTVSYDDGSQVQAAARPLGGTGLLPASLVPSPSPLDVGAAAAGGVTAALLAVTNPGDVEATAIAATFGGPFAFAGVTYPGTLGTCGPTLAPGASCALDVAFLPATTGPAAGSLQLDYDSGLGAASAAASLAGTGLAPASLAFGGAADFGSVLVGARPAAVFTITNTGEVPAAVGLLAVDPPFEWNAGTAAASGTCDEASPLAPAESCTVEIAFAPTQAGAVTGNLSVSFSDEAGPRSSALALSGLGLSPAVLTLSDGGVFDFGTLAVGAKATHVVHVTNTGEWAAALGAATVDAPFGFEGGTYPGTGGDCGATLGAGYSCRVVLAFQPAAAGLAAGTLTLPYSDGVQARSRALALSGTGTDQAFVTVTDWPPLYYTGYGLPPDGPAHDYGTVGVGRSASHTFFVTNTGAGAATLLADDGFLGPFAWKGGAYPGAGGTCADTLAAGETCQVVVDFAPTSAGPASGAFSLTYDDGLSAQGATRLLAGSGTDLASLAVYDFDPGILFGDAWDFGPTGVGVTSEKDFYVLNGGAGPATAVTGLAPPAGFEWKGGTFPGVGGSCGATLAPGASCRAMAVFRPAAPGSVEGALQVSYDDGSGATRIAARAVRGTGVTSALLAIELEGGVVANFGVVGVGATRDRTLRVRNLGGAEATGIAARPLSAPFSMEGGGYPGTGGTCFATLAPGAECTLVVRFAPVAVGSFGAQLALDYADGAGPAVATRDLSGFGTDQALLAVADWPDGFDRDEPMGAVDFGTTGAPVTRTLYVRNLGAQDATGVAFSIASPRFSMAGTTCTGTIAPGATCAVAVTFTPSGDGPTGGTLRIDYGAGAGPAVATQALTGTSTTRAAVFVTTCGTCSDPWYPDDYDFGVTGGPVWQAFYLKNDGAQDATLQPDPVGGAPIFDWAYGGAFPGVDPTTQSWPGDAPVCGATLPAGGVCRLQLAFSPPAWDGVHGGLLSIPYSDALGAAGAVSLALSGTSTTKPLVEIRDPRGGGWGGEGPPPVDFGTSGQDVVRELFVVNRGGGDATLDAATLPAGFAWTSGTWPGVPSAGTQPPACGSTLAAGEACSISITFEAGTLPAGAHAGTLSLAWGPGGQTLSQPLTGVAVDRALVVVSDWLGQEPGSGQPPHDFGTSGVPVTRTFYVTNFGRQAATLAPAAFGSGVFDWAAWSAGGYPGGDPTEPPPSWNPAEGPFCGATLEAGATCRVSVTFTPPLASQLYADTIGLPYSDAGGPVGTASRDVVGIATDQPLVEIGDWPNDHPWYGRGPYDFGVLGQPATHAFVVRNVGGGVAVLKDASLPLGFAFPDAAGTYLGVFPGEGPVDPWYPPLCSDPAVSFLLPPGGECSVLVSFVPASVVPPGSVQGPLVVHHDDGAGGPTMAATRDLSGTATDRAVIGLGDWPGQVTWQGEPPFDYGEAAQPVYHFFYLRNDGAAAADVTVGPLGPAFQVLDPAAAGLPPPGAGEPEDCPVTLATGGQATLAAGASCRLAVEFSAPLPGGPYATTLVVTWADGLGPDGEARRELGGTSIDGPLLHLRDWEWWGWSWQSPPFDFGVAGSPVHHWFYVSNEGRSPGSISSITVGAGFEVVAPAPGEVAPAWPPPPACQDVASLAPGESCALRVTFRPDLVPTEGPVFSTLEISYGGATAPLRRDLAGTVTHQPLLAVTAEGEPWCEDPLCGPAWMSAPPGGSSWRRFWVENRGGGDALDLSDGGGLSSPFDWVGGTFPGDLVGADACVAGASLAPGASCHLDVEFAPTATGTFTSSVKVGFLRGPGDPAVAERAVEGQAF